LLALSARPLKTMSVPPFVSLRLNNMPCVYRCEPGWRWTPPPLSDYDLWCVLEGEGEMRVGGETYVLRSGICFIVPPGATPNARQNPERRLIVFAVHFDPLDARGEIVPASALGMPQAHFLRDLPFFEAMAYRCEAGAARGDALGQRQSVLLLEQMLLQVYAESARAETSAIDARIREVAREIRAAPGEDWSVNEQARRVCLSRSQYTRRFTAATGVSPTRFVVQVRLERAAQLIRETDMSLSEIASVLGYRDLFFFSRQFKKHRGIAPSVLRRSASPSASHPA
jgi:AraC family transcriptional regulator, arabinose operon regulatory protein